MQLSDLWERIVSLLYPPRCLFCDEVVEFGKVHCANCGLERAPYRSTSHEELRLIRSPFLYDGTARDMVLRLKRRAEKETAGYFAEQMAALWLEVDPSPLPTAVVPVPCSADRLRKVGFNHAALLAEPLARLLALPLCGEALVRLETGQIQHTLSAQERYVHARRAFAAGERASALAGQAVLLVDDVCTTGATLSACAALLKTAGASCVYGLTATHTGE